MREANPAIVAALDIGDHGIELVRAHQVDRQVLALGALENRAPGIEVPEMGGDDPLDAGLRCNLAVSMPGVNVASLRMKESNEEKWAEEEREHEGGCGAYPHEERQPLRFLSEHN